MIKRGFSREISDIILKGLFRSILEGREFLKYFMEDFLKESLVHKNSEKNALLMITKGNLICIIESVLYSGR